jgi:hypothetical protein
MAHYRKGQMQQPGVVVHICNPSTWEAEAGGLRFRGLGYVARPV